MTDRQQIREALEALIESARLLGATQAKKGFGCYSQEDAMLERAWYESIDKHSATLRAALAEQPAEHEPVNEADELLLNLGLDPDTYRTDGGYINHLKVKAAIRHPENYPQKCIHEWVAAPPSLGGALCKKCGTPERRPVPAAPQPAPQPGDKPS